MNEKSKITEAEEKAQKLYYWFGSDSKDLSEIMEYLKNSAEYSVRLLKKFPERFKMDKETGLNFWRIIEGKPEITFEGKPDEESLKILTDSKFWERISKELDKEIVKEHRARKTVFLTANGRNVINADKTSFNLMLDSESGAGKDWITGNVLNIIPSNERIKRRGISPKALRWMNTRDKNWTWDKKVLYIEDIPNNVLNDETFKTMASSEEGISTVVESTQEGIKVHDLKVRGKPVIIITSANPSLRKEMIRRFGSLNLDESIDQTKAIIKKKLERAKSGKVEEYDPKITRALMYLKREKVIIPWAEKLEDHVPDHLILRTSLSRFLDYIKSSCVLFQFQREKDNKGFLIAQREDYVFAKECFEGIISTKWLTLSKNEKRVLGIVKEKNDEVAGLSITDLEPHTPFIRTRQTLYNIMGKLTELGLLKAEMGERSESNKPLMVWKYREVDNVSLPEWEELGKVSK